MSSNEDSNNNSLLAAEAASETAASDAAKPTKPVEGQQPAEAPEPAQAQAQAPDAPAAQTGEPAEQQAAEQQQQQQPSANEQAPAAAESQPTSDAQPEAASNLGAEVAKMTVTDEVSQNNDSGSQAVGQPADCSVIDTKAPEVGGAQPQQQQDAKLEARCNLTLVLHEKLRMQLEQRPLPGKPKAHEVQLATHTVGICGSDVKYWQCGKIGDFVLRHPMILGHETSAIVMEVGEQVNSLKPGDKVAVEVGLPCSTCQLCRQGKYNLCSQMSFAATPPHDGTLTRYFNHPADFCFKLPDAVSLEDGALLEPMAVAVHACQRAPIKLGDVALVCGAGAVGLLAMLSAKAFGASKVIITDISESRLKFAQELGADEVILIKRESSPSELATQVRQLASKHKQASAGVDVVLECSGAESSMQLAILSACVGGQIVCVGCQADAVTIPLNSAVMQEIDIKGVFRYRNCYPLAMSLVESGKINLRPLVTHRFALEQAVQAFETCLRGEGVKILINCLDEKLNLDK